MYITAVTRHNTQPNQICKIPRTGVRDQQSPRKRPVGIDRTSTKNHRDVDSKEQNISLSNVRRRSKFWDRQF